MGEPINVMSVAFLAKANRNDDDEYPATIDAVDDAVALTDRSEASKTGKFFSEWLALLLGFMG